VATGKTVTTKAMVAVTTIDPIPETSLITRHAGTSAASLFHAGPDGRATHLQSSGHGLSAKITLDAAPLPHTPRSRDMQPRRAAGVGNDAHDRLPSVDRDATVRRPQGGALVSFANVPPTPDQIRFRGPVEPPCPRAGRNHAQHPERQHHGRGLHPHPGRLRPVRPGPSLRHDFSPKNRIGAIDGSGAEFLKIPLPTG